MNQERNPYTYDCTLIEVVDGNTLSLSIDLGFFLDYRCLVSLADVAAPPILTLNATEKAHGLFAKNFVQAELDKAIAMQVTSREYHRYRHVPVDGVIRYLRAEDEPEERWRSLNYALSVHLQDEEGYDSDN